MKEARYDTRIWFLHTSDSDYSLKSDIEEGLFFLQAGSLATYLSTYDPQCHIHS